jgi:hypothetical protein
MSTVNESVAGAPDDKARATRLVRADDVPAFVRDELLAASRTLPIVVVTSTDRGEFVVDATVLAERFDGRIDVVRIENGPDTWALAQALPSKLEVYGGAVRVYWPQMTVVDEPDAHPLLLMTVDGGAATLTKRVVATVAEWLETGSRGTTVAGERLRHWRAAEAHYRAGDVTRATVQRHTAGGGLLVELVPHVTGHVRRGDLPPGRAADNFAVGDRIVVRVLKAPDAQERRFEASLRNIPTRIKLKPPPRMETSDERSAADADALDAPALRLLVRDLAAELKGLRTDLAAACGERDEARARADEVGRDARTASERAAALERDLLPLLVTSEPVFLGAVRAHYDALYTPADQAAYPLKDVRLHPSFLETLRSLQGVDPLKVIEVACHVAAGRAHEMTGLAVHALRTTTGGGSPQRTRSDGAKAYRCALQREAASARRLHWWQLAGGDVELASVAVHDDFSIPE